MFVRQTDMQAWVFIGAITLHFARQTPGAREDENPGPRLTAKMGPVAASRIRATLLSNKSNAQRAWVLD